MLVACLSFVVVIWIDVLGAKHHHHNFTYGTFKLVDSWKINEHATKFWFDLLFLCSKAGFSINNSSTSLPGE